MNLEIAAFLTDAAANGSAFASSLLDQYHRRGSLSEHQMACVERMMEEARNRTAPAVVDLAPIKAVLDKAAGHLKHPKLRAEGVILSLAPATGANAGAVYVKSDSKEYLGKIKADGTWRPMRGTPAGITDVLVAIAADPEGYAKAYGRRFGVCCCCGRELTAEDSIEAGIGPICAERFF